jgi:hypothetical protein
VIGRQPWKDVSGQVTALVSTRGDPVTDGPHEDAFLLAGGTAHELEPGTRTDLVRLADGRIGYATATSFQPVGDDDDLEQITLNTGDERGTSVLSLTFGDGEVRDTVGESGAAVSKRLRADGYIVSAQQLEAPAPPPPERAVERSEGIGTEAAPQSPPPSTAPLARERPAPRPVAAEPVVPAGPAVPFRERAADVVRPALTLLRLAVLIVGGVVVAILVINVLLLLANANQDNGLVTFFRHASKTLAWEFKDVFEPRTKKAIITENYLLAAAVYLVVTVGLARVLLRLRGANPVRRP